MSVWIKKLHMYAGLLNFTILMVFGIAGLTAAFQVERRFNVHTETHDFAIPPNLDDVGAAQAAVEFLHIPTGMPNKNQVRRDEENNVSFNAFTPAGPRIVTLLEKTNQVRVEVRENRIWHFFDNLHSQTIGERNVPDLRLRMWTWYTEFSIWSLVFMSASGIYLWLASRPAYRWAQFTFAAGSTVFVMLWVISR